MTSLTRTSSSIRSAFRETIGVSVAQRSHVHVRSNSILASRKNVTCSASRVYPSKPQSPLTAQASASTSTSETHSNLQSRNTSSTSTQTAMSYMTTDLKSSDLFSLLANRRTYYSLNSTSPIPDSKIESILTQVFRTVPSSFNTQSTRFILLLGPAHHKLWDITANLLRQHMGEERWASAPTAGKLQSFRAGHGTVLFYEDQADVEEKKSQFKNYASYFDGWTEHTSGMHQLATWVALEAEGLGCNLQHYNGVIDADVAKEFDVPSTWNLRAQMVFGGVEGGRPAEKDKKPTDVVLKVFGKE